MSTISSVSNYSSYTGYNTSSTTATQRQQQFQKQLLAKLDGSTGWTAEAQRLSRLVDAGRTGSILAFRMPGDRLEQLLQVGAAQGISASSRESYLRVAFHGWHSADDVERCAEWLLAS